MYRCVRSYENRKSIAYTVRTIYSDSNVLTRLFYNVIKHRKFSGSETVPYSNNIVIIQSAGNGYNLQITDTEIESEIHNMQ